MPELLDGAILQWRDADEVIQNGYTRVVLISKSCGGTDLNQAMDGPGLFRGIGDAARAIWSAWTAGIQHRDVSIGNVILTHQPDPAGDDRALECECPSSPCSCGFPVQFSSMLIDFGNSRQFDWPLAWNT